jgi:hypothetical protein
MDPLGLARKAYGWPGPWRGVVLILKNGQRIVVYPEAPDELQKIIEQYAGQIAEVWIYDHGGPGVQQIGPWAIGTGPGPHYVFGWMPGAHIHLQGCDVAQDREYLQEIANATGACVTGSTEDYYATPFGPCSWTFGQEITVCPEPEVIDLGPNVPNPFKGVGSAPDDDEIIEDPLFDPKWILQPSD